MGALSWGLDLANFEGVPVRLHGFEMENVSMMWSAFVAQIFRQVRVSLIVSSTMTSLSNKPHCVVEGLLQDPSHILLDILQIEDKASLLLLSSRLYILHMC